METPGSVEPVAMQKLPGISVSMQTETSWLHEHAYGKSSKNQVCSGNRLLTCMVVHSGWLFKEDFVKLFKKSLCTLPSIGLPTLLAYRPELSRDNIQIETEEDSAPCCEYCGGLLKRFPSFEDIGPPFQDRKTREDARSVPAAVDAPDAPGTKADRLPSKERAYQRYPFQPEMPTSPSYNFPAEVPGSQHQQCQPYPVHTNPSLCSLGSNQTGTISYLLSREPPSPKGWTLVVGAGLLSSILSFLFQSQVAKNELLEKYYKHGGKFLTMLPDGTAQLFYPSGNLAIIVARDKNQLICIVQEDKPSNAGIQAVFKSNGRNTCYYPNRAVWYVQGGQYLDQAGNRVRRWTWPNGIMSSGAHVPLSPIFISLNLYVGVRILGQDKITVSFLAMGQQAKFNVGTKVQVFLNDIGRLPPPVRLSEDELLLLAFRVRILHLFDRLRGCLNFPSNEQWDKIKPPAYLITQTLKILQLCTTSDISDELRSSVRAIVNAQV
uniref:Glutamate rich 6 n=1 Tax=Calidris pygmaea TaxID=425635 RepID=A0A8C3JE16_9CHAR